MKLIARIAMLGSWGILSVSIVVILVQTALGDPVPMLDLVDLPLDLSNPPGWSFVTGAAFVLFAIASLGAAYWQLHRVLQRASANEFAALADHLRQCGRALMWFWVAFSLISRVQPFLMLWNVPLADQPEVEWFPLDLDIIFLVLAVALWSVAGTMRQAAVIDDENRHFL